MKLPVASQLTRSFGATAYESHYSVASVAPDQRYQGRFGQRLVPGAFAFLYRQAVEHFAIRHFINLNPLTSVNT
ncbi:MAG: hypothetical protein DMG58_10650 [Acidobacteria bacterium]|nr:MAG: hypothetical protein DMG58_10650 [Acidobacteriota bacterium]